MAKRDLPTTDVEQFFEEDEIIVSKTDIHGVITYANRVFCRVAGYSEAELLGQPHSIIRHPKMPKIIFKLLWDTIESGSEIFAYVINRCKNGDFYWVFAHVTPSFDSNHKIIGYHSNRRVPDRDVLKNVIEPLYQKLLEEEEKYSEPKKAMAASQKLVEAFIAEKGMAYHELIFKL